MVEIKVDYEKARVESVRADAEKAVQKLLSGDVGTAITIFPQALNPLLKAFESLGLWKQIVVLPDIDSNRKPLYIVVKVGSTDFIESIIVGESV